MLSVGPDTYADNLSILLINSFEESILRKNTTVPEVKVTVPEVKVTVPEVKVTFDFNLPRLPEVKDSISST
jgi:hypothetical protein